MIKFWKHQKNPKRKCKGKRVQMATFITCLITEQNIETPRNLYLRVMLHQKSRKVITPQACIRFAQKELHMQEDEIYELYELCGYSACEYTPNVITRRFYTDVAQLVWYNTHNLDNNFIQNKFHDNRTPLPNCLKHKNEKELERVIRK